MQVASNRTVVPDIEQVVPWVRTVVPDIEQARGTWVYVRQPSPVGGPVGGGDSIRPNEVVSLSKYMQWPPVGAAIRPISDAVLLSICSGRHSSSNGAVSRKFALMTQHEVVRQPRDSDVRIMAAADMRLTPDVGLADVIIEGFA